ncbi:unnamed protein product [Ascophyllum nodosum]
MRLLYGTLRWEIPVVVAKNYRGPICRSPPLHRDGHKNLKDGKPAREYRTRYQDDSSHGFGTSGRPPRCLLSRPSPVSFFDLFSDSRTPTREKVPSIVKYVITPELYSTKYRVVGLGSASVWTRIGGMVAPIMAEVLFDRSPILPLAAFCPAMIICGIFAGFIPVETAGRKLDDDSWDCNSFIPANDRTPAAGVANGR